MSNDKQTPEQIRDNTIKAAKKAFLAEVAAAKAKQETTVREAWSTFIEQSAPAAKAA